MPLADGAPLLSTENWNTNATPSAPAIPWWRIEPCNPGEGERDREGEREREGEGGPW